MKTISICVAAASVAAFSAFAALEPISPVDGETVPQLTAAQKKISALQTYGERLAELQADEKKDENHRFYAKDKSKKWRVSEPLRLRWRATEGEKAPWKIVISKNPDLSGGMEFWSEGHSVSECGRDDKGEIYRYKNSHPNLELGATYYWKVWGNAKCPVSSCGSTVNGTCTCGKTKQAAASPVSSFKTEDAAPRWIAIEGRTKNIRDLGGWKTSDGRRVRQNMVFRGEGLNDNSITGEKRGRNRLMVEDVDYLKGTLGIKTDLDLRNAREISTLVQSPLGDGVKFIPRSSPAYAGIFKTDKEQLPSRGMKTMAENFRVFCDAGNYPIYFHCIGGADRTGSLAYVLNGVLGVSKHDLEIDWESTFYPRLPEMEKSCNGPDYWRLGQHFDRGFSKYGDANSTWNERIVLYLLDCGVTKDEIERFRAIMLEPATAAKK